MTGQITITLNGEAVLLNFGNYAFQTYTELTGIGIGDNPKEVSENYSEMDALVDVVYCGMVGDCMAKSKAVDFGIEDVRAMCNNISVLDKLRVFKEFQACTLKLTVEMLEALKFLNGQSEEKKK